MEHCIGASQIQWNRRKEKGQGIILADAAAIAARTEPVEYSAACRNTLIIEGESNQTSVGTLLAQLALC